MTDSKSGMLLGMAWHDSSLSEQCLDWGWQVSNPRPYILSLLAQSGSDLLAPDCPSCCCDPA